jgi:hypothetical protein
MIQIPIKIDITVGCEKYKTTNTNGIGVNPRYLKKKFPRVVFKFANAA